MSEVTLEVEEKVAVITVSSPGVRNAAHARDGSPTRRDL